jgi:multiple sugar transport system permease protein
MLAFFVFPVAYALYLSAFSTRGLFLSVFVGISNYVRVLEAASFWVAVLRMVYFGFIQVTVMIALATFFALAIDSQVLLSNFYRLVYFLPYAIPGVVAALMWGYMYAPSFGALTPLLSRLMGHSVNLLGQGVVLYSIANVVTWEWTGYNMILLLAGLTSVSPTIIDAARVDGASDLQISLRIKLPLIRHVVLLTLVLSIIGTLQLFSEPYIFSALTTISPTFSPNLDIYTTTFSYGNFDYAAAMAIVLGVVTFGATYALLRVTRRGAV